MTLQFYKFNKKKNSTGIPGAAQALGNPINVVWKESTDIHNPTVEITGSHFYGDANYCKITYKYNGDLQTIYCWINSTRAENYDRIIIECSIDVLATYRDYIIGSQQFVTYSTLGYDSFIIDNRIPVQQVPIFTHGETVIPLLSRNPVPIISTVSGDGGEFVTSYVLTDTTLNQLANRFLQTDWNDVVKDTWDYLVTQFTSAYDTIVSLRWVCVNPAVTISVGISDTVKFGRYDSGIDAVRLPQRTLSGEIRQIIEWNYPVNDWRNHSPYTAVQCWLPGYGIVDMSPEWLHNFGRILVRYTVDIISGDIVYFLMPEDTEYWIVGTYRGNVSADRPIAQSQSNLISGITGAAQVGAGLYSGNMALTLSGANSVISGIQSLNSHSPVTTGIAPLEWEPFFRMWVMSYAPADIDSIGQFMGRPTFAKRTIVGADTYVQCDSARVECPAYGNEKTEIENFLNGGVFIE